MIRNIQQFLYDPIKARVVYDFCVAAGLSALFWGAGWYFGQAPFEIVLVMAIPVLYIALNFLIGMYSYLKLVPVLAKSLALMFSISIVSGLVLLFEPMSAWLVLLFTMIWLICSLPRIFFNFHVSSFKKSNLDTTVHALLSSKQPILIVGGAGYIGSHLVEKLLDQNYRVRVLDSFLFGYNPLKELIKHPNLEVIEGDATNIFELTQAMNDCSSVVHLAGIVGDPACAVDEELTRHINIVSTRMVKETAKAFGIQRFIFSSSCSVYGIAQEKVDETSSLNPVSLYAHTKIDSEKELLRDTFDNFHPTILRFATVFGHSRRMRFDLVGNLFTGQAFTTGKLSVFGGDQWRPFIHVEDIARAIVLALEAPLETVSRAVFNVGHDDLNSTIGGLAHQVMSVAQDIDDKKVKIVGDDMPSDARNYAVSFAKIQQQLGFYPKHTIKSGIKEMYKHFLDGTYELPITNSHYSNVKTTELLRTTFKSIEYRSTHYSVIEEKD